MEVNYSLIKERRKELKLTGEKLGELIGVSKQTISKYENGSVSINNSTLRKLSDVLDIDLNEFYGRETNNMQRVYVPTTIAAHHDLEEWTIDELEEIEKFKEFIKSKRQMGWVIEQVWDFSWKMPIFWSRCLRKRYDKQRFVLWWLCLAQ